MLSESGGNILFISKGPEYFSVLKKLIREAREEIHFQTYIFDPDKTGNEILGLLHEAAERGVRIFLVIDGYGSWRLAMELRKKNLSSGFSVKIFSPPFFEFFLYAGRRLHHKIVCVDREKILVGGINIADKYHGDDTTPAWLDFALYVKDPALSEIARKICLAIYEKTFHVTYPRFRKKNNSLSSENNLLQNDWLRGKNQIFKYYRSLLQQARSEIIIVGAYFLPGYRFRQALKKASRRGVNIKLILAGISDVPLVRNATLHLYGFLLKHKMEIYEWHRSVLHGKLILADRETLVVGSYNINHLSQYGSIELNLATKNSEACHTAHLQLNEILKQSVPVTNPQPFSPFKKFLHRICFILVRVSITLTILKPTFIKIKRNL